MTAAQSPQNCKKASTSITAARMAAESVHSPTCASKSFSDRMGELLKGIYVPETIAQTIVDSLQSDSTRAESERQKRIGATQQRIAALRARMDQMYEDKLDGKIDDEF